MKYFGAIYNVLRRMDELENEMVLRSLFALNGDDIESYIISLNQEEQLFNKGIDSTGTRLDNIGGDYTEFTIFVKQQSSLPFDRITLFQTGEFYDTFGVKLVKEDIIIFADTTKVNNRGKLIDLRDRWGDNIIGLTEESKSELVDFLIPFINDFIISYLLQDQTA